MSYIHFNIKKDRIAPGMVKTTKMAVRIVNRNHPIAHSYLSDCKKNYYLDVSNFSRNNRGRWLLGLGMYIRKKFNTIEECRKFLFELKGKYGLKHSRFIIKEDDLGVLK